MRRGRLEAFSDGVMAIIITILVLELKVPHGDTLGDLGHVMWSFLTYALSFIFVGSYWNNHHHLLNTTQRVNGWILWANNYLMFWLSIIPFVTSWVTETRAAHVPIAVYGVVLFMSDLAFMLLERSIIKAQGTKSTLRRAIGRDIRGKFSAALYLMATGMAFINRGVSVAIYVMVAIMWLAPDRRIAATDLSQ